MIISMVPELWQARVIITQVPTSNHYELVSDLESNSKETDIHKSWLCNPFMDNTIYGTEFQIASDFSWTFFIPTSNKSQATYKGYFLLNYLKGKFSGLDGNVQVVQITSEKLNNNRYLYELRLPKADSTYFKKILLLKKFINLYYHRFHKVPLSMYILWQIDDSISEEDRFSIKTEKLATNIFKVRIFFQTKSELTQFSEMNQIELETLAYLKSITSEIQTALNRNAKLTEGNHTTWQDIVTGNIFWQNDNKIFTGKCYERIYEQIPLQHRPCFLSANVTDFIILKEFPLLKAHTIENENINFNSNHLRHQGAILYGKYVHNGVQTQVDTFLYQEHFAQSVLIVGQQGTGKTYFLRQIINEFYKKAPPIGILILNLAKENQERLYSVDRVIKYDSPQFKIPYFIEGQHTEKCLQETAAYLIASLGLKNIVEKNMLTVMKSFYYNKEGLPPSLNTLFSNLEKFFKENPYHEKFQTNILRAIKNRILSLLIDPKLEKTLQLSKEVPNWIKEWFAGKKVFIDLSMCNIYVKRLLSNAIFQMVRALLPEMDVHILNYLIVVDEAHQIFEKSASKNPDDDDFITRDQLERIFTELMKDFRSKGLSFILADHQPSRLFSCISTLPSLKFLFRLGYPDNILFSGDRVEQNYLSIQANRNALILNGITGERFVFSTLDI